MLASWLIVDENLHNRLMSTESVDTKTLLEHVAETQNTYLWFMDLITPFSTSLPILRQLRDQMGQFQHAWQVIRGINKITFDNEQEPILPSLPRKLWEGNQ